MACRLLCVSFITAFLAACPPPDNPNTGGADVRCGDGVVSGDEACDDGNDLDGDACLNDCTVAFCGDGVVRTGMESCDDGNSDPRDGCTDACADARCGDGVVRVDLGPGDVGYESCDDGNSIDTDECVACDDARCGDGFVQDLVEGCDDGNTEDGDVCTNACQQAECGDGIVRSDLSDGEEGYEACDDGNLEDLDGCTAACIPARCGDGIHRQDLTPGAVGAEECDDGNEVNEDECSNDCVLPYCGDGWLTTGESCDDGNDQSNDGCTNDCELARCGDGVLRVDRVQGQVDFEACDDGNEVDEDGCIDCVPAQCGDGITRGDLEPDAEGYEACDDANDEEDDACLDDCVAARCGDGIVRRDLDPDEAGYEACDDGDDMPNDDCAGCEATCAVHSNCPGLTGFCVVAPGDVRGVCLDTRRHVCAEDRDCQGADVLGTSLGLLCEEERCLSLEMSRCNDLLGCGEEMVCQGTRGNQTCRRPCEANGDCPDPRMACELDGDEGICNWVFCGGEDELPAGFAGYAQGQLGGACANEREDVEDGYCHEYDVGGGNYIGACFDGGALDEGDPCDQDVDRDDDDAQCGGGLACAGYDAEGASHCRQTCQLDWQNGLRDCPEGSRCVVAQIRAGHRGGFYSGMVCLPEAEQCDAVALDSCGDDARCAVLSSRTRTSHCELFADREQLPGPGESCEENSECPDGYYCFNRSSCRRLCVTNDDCEEGWTCDVRDGYEFSACEAPEEEEAEDEG
ncbi:MAG: hypothetical protein CMH50_02890 [Myxococcales bacterium]|nr:hypothetical protein [Myxococcales bacterium]